MHSSKKRTIVYVDGLNFFGGAFQDESVRNNVPRKNRWLDLRSLLEKTLPADFQMAEIKYFTSVIRGDNVGASAQSTYISALERYAPRKPDINVFQGRMQEGRHSGFLPIFIKDENGKWEERSIFTEELNPKSSEKQYISIHGYKEKQTDVTLGAHIVADALRDKCDCIALLSSDSDFVGALRLVKEIKPSIEMLLVLPGGRKSGELLSVASQSVSVHTADIISSHLPEIFEVGGKVIECPETWSESTTAPSSGEPS